MSEAKPRAPRNPEGRKRQIIEAAAALMAREGTRKLTHRTIAEEAGVPLGSTTQYFSSIDELRQAGLAELARQIECDYDSMFNSIKEMGGSADAFINECITYLADTRSVHNDAYLIGAAISDPEIRNLYRNAFKRTVTWSNNYMTEEQAQAFTIFLDGLTIDAYLLEQPIDPKVVRQAIKGIMGC